LVKSFLPWSFAFDVIDDVSGFACDFFGFVPLLPFVGDSSFYGFSVLFGLFSQSSLCTAAI